MKVRFFVLSLFFAACCAIGLAQAVVPSITVRSTERKLGMAADSVIATLQRSYAVQSDDKSTAHSWYVSTGKNAMPFAGLYVRSNSIVGIEYLVTERETSDIQRGFCWV
jgi:hypothetical protein